jgi:succinyl-CoA synthetase alpha subunit
MCYPGFKICFQIHNLHRCGGELYIGVVNKSGGESAKLATRLTPEQIALFRMVGGCTS